VLRRASMNDRLQNSPADPEIDAVAHLDKLAEQGFSRGKTL
jgi:hypothetical protein